MTPEKIKEKISMVNKDIDKLTKSLKKLANKTKEAIVIVGNIENLKNYLRFLNEALSFQTNYVK